MNFNKTDIEKPDGWPVSNREAILEEIYLVLEQFIKEPTYKNKELLFSLINHNDINEMNSLGCFRITQYEVALINTIYVYANIIHCESIKIYLYRFLANTARMQKMLFYIFENLKQQIPFVPEEYHNLHNVLRLFYMVYATFNYEKKQPFCDAIIEVSQKIAGEMRGDEEQLFELARSYVMMIRELSEFKSSKIFGIITFSRDEIYRLFKTESLLLDLSKQDPYQKPLKSVLILTIRNWVLRSRNDYSEEYFYKCISENNALMALNNHEIWMKKIDKLNDPREGKVFEELIGDDNWKKHEWAKNISVSQPDNHYVCSYTKTIPDDRMKQEYGDNVFGYKNDRISDVLSPLGMLHGHVFLGDVLYYDVVYSKDEAIAELNYLCDLIELFNFSDEEKGNFLSEILQYWFLSFKDPEWSCENERRYHIVLSNSMQHVESRIEDDFYKNKTSIYLFPDFVFATGLVKDIVSEYRTEKIEALSTKSYLYCKNCLQSDYDYINNKYKNKCVVCGSEDTEIIDLM